MEAMLTTKERKKEFDNIYKEIILPFFNDQGFERYTAGSKRVFKKYANGLSVFIFFEFKNFGSGFYDISIAYYDTDMGTVDEDTYIAVPQIKKPNIKGKTADELRSSTNEWIEKMKTTVIAFIETHSTHKAILSSDQFYYSKPREEECKELLKRKAAI